MNEMDYNTTNETIETIETEKMETVELKEENSKKPDTESFKKKKNWFQIGFYAIITIAVIVLYVPFVTGLYGYIYLGIVTPVAIFVAYILSSLIKNRENPGKIQRNIKKAMYLVLLIFLLNALIYKVV